MKKLLYLLPVLAVLFASCEDEKDLVKTGVATLEATDVQMFSATLNGKVLLPEQMAMDFGIGFEISKEQMFPEESTQKLQVKAYNPKCEFSCKAESPDWGQTYYVRAYMINQMCLYYGKTKTFKTSEYKFDAGECVDLGLSVKWATFNVGATAPWEYGDYFAWGEVTPYYETGYAQEDPQSHWKTGKSAGYTWSSYKYCKGDYNTQTKYCQGSSYGYNGYTDSKTVLDPYDDAASVNWGGSWRMPTRAEQDELRNTANCTWQWYSSGNAEFNGVAGFKVTSKKSGYTDKFIFLPAAGYRYDTDLDYVGFCGSYWSSSLYASDPSLAYGLYFDSGFYSTLENYRRCGQSVRPVCP